MRTLTYIWHDCFIYEDGDKLLIFDFWKDPESADKTFPDFIKNANKNMDVTVFVSHYHKDHYTKRIFEWEKLFNKITFIISPDVAKHARHILDAGSMYVGYKPSSGNVKILRPGETFDDGTICVSAFSSTDIGNSYAVEINGRVVFHAGDLNAWIWKEESTLEEVEEEISKFDVILNTISNKFPKIDIAMFPVDSRIGRDYFTGAAMFVRKIDVGHFIPMHFSFGETEEEKRKFKRDAVRFEEYANTNRGEYIGLQSPYSKLGLPS